MIHGLGDSPIIFQDIATELMNDFRIVAYSRRSHYKSTALDTRYTNEELVSDLKLLADNLNKLE